MDPYRYRCRWCGDKPACTMDCLNHIEDIITFEGPQTIAAVIVETVTGTNGIIIPPDGYLQGLRELCTKHGILLICDEIMSGFGRTGEWFARGPLERRARHHDRGQGPDLGLRAARRDHRHRRDRRAVRGQARSTPA